MLTMNNVCYIYAKIISQIIFTFKNFPVMFRIFNVNVTEICFHAYIKIVIIN